MQQAPETFPSQQSGAKMKKVNVPTYQGMKKKKSQMTSLNQRSHHHRTI